MNNVIKITRKDADEIFNRNNTKWLFCEAIMGFVFSTDNRKEYVLIAKEISTAKYYKFVVFAENDDDLVRGIEVLRKEKTTIEWIEKREGE